MAAAYAALISLMHIMDQIKDHGHSFSLNKEQTESLQERTTFLIDFLEGYSQGDSKQVEGLESQIADAAHAAEDIIESKVVDYIHDNRSTSFEETSSDPFCQRLQEVIEVMDFVKKEATKIKGKGEVQDQLPKDSKLSSYSSSLPAGTNIMVGLDDVLIQMMDRLTRQQSDRHIIPIYGMGGIGKTTLTRNIYENPCIVQHFDIRAWVTISQEYEIKEILLNLLREFGVLNNERAQGMSDGQLGEQLHKYLFGRKYLIVMDDMWSINVWDKVKLFIPDTNNGSGIMITTRLSNMASHFGSCGLEMNFLDEDKSWNLLREKVFGQQKCCLELEEIGKKIAKYCKGLPLSIVVIAGILAKSNMTREYWNHVAHAVNSIASLADDGHCSKILSLSYKNLRVHLKSCFLYMGVFPEDYEISVSRLIKLWVAEGFLKPNKAKSFEEVAEEYLIDLIDRNLIMVHKYGSRGKMKTCKIHDLLRDLILTEAKKEKFLFVKNEGCYVSPEVLYSQRRIVIDVTKGQRDYKNLNKPSASLARSITYNIDWGSPLLDCRLLRVLSRSEYQSSLKHAFDLVNLRYLSLKVRWSYSFESQSPINLLWNLQTLIIRGINKGATTPIEIWEMKQLRHLDFGEVSLPPPPPIVAIDGQEESNLKNLQTLVRVYNLTCSEKVVKRIPNIKKLQIVYKDLSMDFKKGINYCLNNIQHLNQLESLGCHFHNYLHEFHLLENLIFPRSLKKLTFDGSWIPSWDDMGTIGRSWNPIERQFLSLRFLLIDWCPALELWNADNIHFPSLEQLFLYHMKYLEKIPLGIGEIPTFRSIQLRDCSNSIVSSAMDILDEQESQDNVGIQVQVWHRNSSLLKNVEKAKDNFKFNIISDGYNLQEILGLE